MWRKLKINKWLLTIVIIMCITCFTSLYILQISNKTVNENLLLAIQVIFIITTILFILIQSKIISIKEILPEKALLLIMPLFCLLILITIPVGRGHDEVIHWYKAFEISEGHLMTPIDEENRVSIANLPKGVENIVVEREKGVFKYIDNISLFNEEIDYNESVSVINQNSSAYCFVQYIPHVIGIFIGKVLTQNQLIIAYIARLFNMVFCTIIMYFAIKKIPFGKNILLALSIIPISIEGFATISPDGITIAMCAMFISYVFYVAFEKNKMCEKKDIIALTIIGAIVSLCKVVYMPLIFLVLIIPKEKFLSKKAWIKAISIIISVGVLLNLIWLVFGSMTLLKTNTNTYFETDESVSFNKLIILLTNPIGYLQKIFYTIGTNIDEYFLSLFGGYLEWSEMVSIPIMAFITFGLIILTNFIEKNNNIKIEKYQKIVISLIIIIITLLIFTSIYIQWSNINVNYINGIQGRYFLPILPLILILIPRIDLKTKYSNKDMTKIICIFSYMIQIYTVANIVALHI